MSRRLLSSRLPPLIRRAPVERHFHAPSISTSSGGLLRTANVATRIAPRGTWPSGAYFVHHVPAVRAISFQRVIPKLFVKFARIPAAFGGAMIAGLAYIQYQAQR